MLGIGKYKLTEKKLHSRKFESLSSLTFFVVKNFKADPTFAR